MATIKKESKETGIEYGVFTPAKGKLPGSVRTSTFAPMIKPIHFPVGQRLSGVLKRLFVCREFVGDTGIPKKGWAFEIEAENGIVAMPLTQTLKSGLEVDNEGHTPNIGKTVHIELLPDRIPSKRGQAAWNFVVGIED